MKSALAPVKLRRSFWNAPEPRPFDVLQTSTGRRYEIKRVAGKTLHCRVLPDGAELQDGCRIFYWQWNAKK